MIFVRIREKEFGAKRGVYGQVGYIATTLLFIPLLASRPPFPCSYPLICYPDMAAQFTGDSMTALGGSIGRQDEEMDVDTSYQQSDSPQQLQEQATGSRKDKGKEAVPKVIAWSTEEGSFSESTKLTTVPFSLIRRPIDTPSPEDTPPLLSRQVSVHSEATSDVDASQEDSQMLPGGVLACHVPKFEPAPSSKTRLKAHEMEKGIDYMKWARMTPQEVNVYAARHPNEYVAYFGENRVCNVVSAKNVQR